MISWLCAPWFIGLCAITLVLLVVLCCLSYYNYGSWLEWADWCHESCSLVLHFITWVLNSSLWSRLSGISGAVVNVFRILGKLVILGFIAWCDWL